MFCKNCGNPTEDGSEYCKYCNPNKQVNNYYEEEEDGILYYYIKVLRNFGDFSSRARRKEYWYFVLVHLILCVVLSILFFVPIVNILALILGGIYALLVLIPWVAVTVRRLHDTNRSGWFIFVSLIPAVGWIFSLFMMVQEGTPGYNDYGPDPKDW